MRDLCGRYSALDIYVLLFVAPECEQQPRTVKDIANQYVFLIEKVNIDLR